MFGRKKESRKAAPPRTTRDPTRPPPKLSAFGLMDVPSIEELENPEEDGADDQAALEAELAQLMGGGASPKRRQQPRGARKEAADLDAMVADCMKDIPSDEEAAAEGDENDPELMAELEEMREMEEEMRQQPPGATVSFPKELQPVGHAGGCSEMQLAGSDLLGTIDERMANYASAREAASASGESSRARRFARGLNTLQELRRKVLSGAAVDEDDIPPPVVVRKVEPKKEEAEEEEAPVEVPSDAPTLPTTRPTPPPVDDAPPAVADPPVAPLPSAARPVLIDQRKNADLARIKQRRDECKAAALAARDAGDKAGAVAGLTAVKECDALMHKLQSGELASVDALPEIGAGPPPPPPPEAPRKVPETAQSAPVPPAGPARQFSRDDPLQLPDNPEDLPPADPALFGAPPPPRTVEEALSQRLAKYRQDEAKAKAEGNAGKARRLGRICKQYEDAMRAHKAGRRIPVEDLPTPPGFAPIPMGAPPPQKTNQSPAAPAPAAGAAAVPAGAAVGAAAPAAAAAAAAGGGAASDAAAAPRKPTQAARASTSSGPRSAREKQLAMLLAQQAQFKAAALEAKKAGQMEQAKEYLRHYKGYDRVIEAARGGLPVDLKTLPVPPQKQSATAMGFEIVRREDCGPPTGDRQTMFAKLEKDLVKQAKMCERNSRHFRETGDVASANKFQQMLEHTKKDLDALRFSFKRNDEVPKFYYEVRSFSRVVCNSDLSDAELELSVVKGINFGVAKNADTYCKLEFPYPKESPFRDRTAVVKTTNNPEYNHRSVIPANPKDKSFQRVFKRHSVKVEVWAKGAFLRSDTLVGTAQVKLQPLETASTVHDSFPLMDGRKAVGGKVEVKVQR